MYLANSIGVQEIAIVAVVIILLFGASALPKFARSIGQAKKEFEKGINEGSTDEPEEKKS
jgi:sec-independent protein translocase protein TatA